jgi:hypothetical protein
MKNPMKFIQEVKQEAFKVSWPYLERDFTGSINGFCNGCCNVIIFSSFGSSFKVFSRTTT